MGHVLACSKALIILKTIVIIPSRIGSERLPRKPLALIHGRTLVERVYAQCRRAEGIDEVYVATDAPSIAEEVERFGGKVIMTSSDCASGTDRVAEAAKLLDTKDGVVINVQGDEPLIDPTVITSLASLMRENPAIQVSTPVTRLVKAEELTNPSIVKVVMNQSWDALYFSRQAIPYLRVASSTSKEAGDKEIYSWVNKYPYFKHIGVYAYRPESLRRFVSLDEAPLERAERLEQLRLLEAGIPIRCLEVQYESVAVDTEEDIRKVELILIERGLG